MSYPCSPVERLAKHAQRVAELLLRADRRRAFDQLVVATPSDLWPVVKAALHSDLLSRVAGLVELRLGDAASQEIARAVVEHAHPESIALRERSDGSGGHVPGATPARRATALVRS